MQTVDRLNKAIAYLKGNLRIKTQSDIANAIGASRISVSQAINGRGNYLTKSFLRKFAGCYDEINLDWLLTGEGEMIKNNTNQASENNNTNTVVVKKVDWEALAAQIREKDEQIRRLIGIIENMGNKK